MSALTEETTGSAEAVPELTSPTNPIRDWLGRLVLLLLVAITTYMSASRVWPNTELLRGQVLFGWHGVRTLGVGYVDGMAISPGGRYVAVVMPSDRLGMKVIDLVTGAPARYTGRLDRFPSWSPDGHTLLFLRLGFLEGDRGLYALDLRRPEAPHRLRQLPPPTALFSLPTWSATGSYIAWTDSDRRLWIEGPGASPARGVADGVCGPLVWGPGDQLLFRREGSSGGLCLWRGGRVITLGDLPGLGRRAEAPLVDAPYPGGSTPGPAAAWEPGGAGLWLGHGSKVWRVDTRSGAARLVKELPRSSGAIWTLSVRPGGKGVLLSLGPRPACLFLDSGGGLHSLPVAVRQPWSTAQWSDETSVAWVYPPRLGSSRGTSELVFMSVK